jgi:hypothetical protein
MAVRGAENARPWAFLSGAVSDLGFNDCAKFNAQHNREAEPPFSSLYRFDFEEVRILAREPPWRGAARPALPDPTILVKAIRSRSSFVEALFAVGIGIACLNANS